MKVAVLGAGGLGRTIAVELAADRDVKQIAVVDKRGARSRTLQSIGGGSTVRALEADVLNPTKLRNILSEVDVAVNATLPENNLNVMKACLDAGCGYVDGAAFTPTSSKEKWGLLEQLQLDSTWRDRGRTAIVSMGSDPGISNIMARVAADRLQTIDSIRVRKAASGGHKAEGYPLYSREIFLRDAMSRPVVWDGQQLAAREPVSGEEDFDFPPPVGKRHLHLFTHEEVLSLPLRLGKPVGLVDYKHDINPELVRAIQALSGLGLLDADRRIRIGEKAISFRDAFLATFPEPSTLIDPLEGALAIVVEVRGTKPDGTKASIVGTLIAENREANRRRGTTAERFLTAAALATGMNLIHAKKVRTGVVAPEELPPELILPMLEARGIAFHVSEVAG